MKKLSWAKNWLRIPSQISRILNLYLNEKMVISMVSILKYSYKEVLLYIGIMNLFLFESILKMPVCLREHAIFNRHTPQTTYFLINNIYFSVMLLKNCRRKIAAHAHKFFRKLWCVPVRGLKPNSIYQLNSKRKCKLAK